MATPTQIRRRGRFSLILGTLVAALMVGAVAFASDANVTSIVDATAPTGSVTLAAGGEESITINMTVTGRQENPASFMVYKTWTLSGGTFTGSDEVTFNVNPQVAGTTTNFSTPGKVVVSSGQAVGGPFSLQVCAHGIVTTAPAALGVGDCATYAVTVSAPANNAPSVVAGGPYSGGEGSNIALNGATASDPDGPGPLSYLWTIDAQSVGTGTCSLTNATSLPAATISCTDNGTATVKLTATEGGVAGTSASDTAAVTINNVAPTVGSISGPTTVLTNRTYEYSVSATDPSIVDTAAGFSWAWDAGSGTFSSYGDLQANPSKHSVTLSTCGSHTIRAKAKDKDGDESNVASLSLGAYDGGYLPPLKGSGFINTVQKGQVVPVKVDVSCNGFLGGLIPSIQLYNGDVDPDTDSTAPLEAVTESVSSADNSGVMRQVDGQYIYNLRVPSGAAGQLYTVTVRPWGAGGPLMKAVLKIRK